MFARKRSFVSCSVRCRFVEDGLVVDAREDARDRGLADLAAVPRAVLGEELARRCAGGLRATIWKSSCRVKAKCSQRRCLTARPRALSSAWRTSLTIGMQPPQPVPARVHAFTASTVVRPSSRDLEADRPGRDVVAGADLRVVGQRPRRRRGPRRRRARARRGSRTSSVLRAREVRAACRRTRRRRRGCRRGAAARRRGTRASCTCPGPGPRRRRRARAPGSWNGSPNVATSVAEELELRRRVGAARSRVASRRGSWRATSAIS